jgi:hypothetical protein
MIIVSTPVILLFYLTSVIDSRSLGSEETRCNGQTACHRLLG